jgi:bifunctional ADP-heptose synthase (sugar kinase/adenylyltransferase)
VLVDALREKANAANVVLKLGSEGLLVHSRNHGHSEVVTDQLPALNLAPKDVAGAGDCLLVAVSLALASGAHIWLSSYLGALAAACQVGRIGNNPINTSDLEAEISA